MPHVIMLKNILQKVLDPDPGADKFQNYITPSLDWYLPVFKVR